jgi:hypothetical protein
MSLPKEIGSHHTMWFTVGHHKPVAVRYAVDNDEVVCFGDHGLCDLVDGSTIAGTVHDIAGGPPLVQTSFDVRVLVSADVALGTIGEVVGHVAPTGTWDEARMERRLIGLRLHGSPRTA